MPAGRPTVATPEMVERAWTYLTDKKRGWQSDEVIPTVEGLAVYLGISKETLYARDQFSDVLKAVKALQGKKLINGSLSGKLNPLISKMMLSSKHDYVEKSAQDLTTKGKELPALVRFIDTPADAATDSQHSS